MIVRLLCSEDAKVRVQRSVSFRDTQIFVSGFNEGIYFVAEKLPNLFAARLNIGKFEFSKFDRTITTIQTT